VKWRGKSATINTNAHLHIDVRFEMNDKSNHDLLITVVAEDCSIAPKLKLKSWTKYFGYF
jgi:hypothetical protein